mgnify:CR=1 FL=1
MLERWLTRVFGKTKKTLGDILDLFSLNLIQTFSEPFDLWIMNQDRWAYQNTTKGWTEAFGGIMKTEEHFRETKKISGYFRLFPYIYTNLTIKIRDFDLYTRLRKSSPSFYTKLKYPTRAYAPTMTLELYDIFSCKGSRCKHWNQ